MPPEYPYVSGAQVNSSSSNSSGGNNNGSDSSSWYGYGSGSGSSITDKEQEASDNLLELVKEQYGNLKKVADMNLETIDLNSKNNQAIADTSILNAKQQAGDDWFTQQSKLQDSASQLNDNAGNMMRGSGLNALKQLYAKQDDQIDVDTLNALQKNMDTIYGNLAESQVANNANYNEQIAKITADLAALLADTKAQQNSINPDLVDETDYSWLNVDEYKDKMKKDMVQQQRTGWFRNADNINGASALWPTNAGVGASASPLYTAQMNSADAYSRRSQP